MLTQNPIAPTLILLAAILSSACTSTSHLAQNSNRDHAPRVTKQQVRIIPNCQTVAGQPHCQWIEPSHPRESGQSEGRQQRVPGIML